MDELAPVIILTTGTLVLGWVVRTVSTNRRLAQTARVHAEMQSKLLERFGTAADAQRFLESDSGRRFFETGERAHPAGRILSSVQTGILVLLASVGVFASRNTIDSDAYELFSFLGTLGMMVGAGFLISSGAIYFISRRLGLPLGPRSTPEAGSANSVDGVD